MTDPDGITDMGTAAILGNMASYLDDLSKDAAQIAEAVSNLTAELETSPPSRTIEKLQKLDALTQSLEDLGRLCQAISSSVDTPTAHSTTLKLAATKSLLEEQAPVTCRERGSIDLF